MEIKEILEKDILESNYVPCGVNQGTVMIEQSRAIAEAQGKLLMAKKFPRDEVAAHSRVIEACQRKGMAEKAFFSFPRGNNTVEGPTILFAKELARCWGNIDYGIKELSQDFGKSELQAYAWDLESNTISVQTFTNPHEREVNKKMVVLSSNRDIYENNANMATRRLRSRILAILPSWLVDDAIAECKRTIAGNNDVPLIDRVKKMLVQFAKLGVSQDMIEMRLGRKVDTMSPEDLAEYVGIFNSLKQGETRPFDWFEQYQYTSDITAELKAES